jgi:SPP1 family predicted phage head-tail adaptor
MNISKKNKKITIQRYDSDKEEYVDNLTLWAEMKAHKWKNVVIAGNYASELLQEVIVWKNDKIEKGCRVKYNNKILDVLNAYSTEKETIIICRNLVM